MHADLTLKMRVKLYCAIEYLKDRIRRVSYYNKTIHLGAGCIVYSGKRLLLQKRASILAISYHAEQEAGSQSQGQN